jgi:hypothetical protein
VGGVAFFIGRGLFSSFFHKNKKGGESMIKTKDKKVFLKKFNRFRIFFFVHAGAFLISLILEFFLYGAGGYLLGAKGGDFREVFFSLLGAEAALYLGAFLFGVTIYAPIFGILACGLRGAFCAFFLSLAAQTFPAGQGILLFVLILIYAFFSSWLFFSYSAFCTNVALRIHSDPQKSRGRREEELFGGTLFYSSLYSNLINLRFLFTYLIFFATALCFSGVFCAVFSFLRSLLLI